MMRVQVSGLDPNPTRLSDFPLGTVRKIHLNALTSEYSRRSSGKIQPFYPQGVARPQAKHRRRAAFGLLPGL